MGEERDLVKGKIGWDAEREKLKWTEYKERWIKKTKSTKKTSWGRQSHTKLQAVVGFRSCYEEKRIRKTS